MLLKLLYALFGHLKTFSAQLRLLYTGFFILYKLKLLSRNLFLYLCKILYIPLIASIFGYLIGGVFFEISNIGSLKINNLLYKNFKKELSLKSDFKTGIIILIINFYKLVIFYLVTKYIKLSISIETLIGCLLLLIYFFVFPFDETYINKNLYHNDLFQLTIIIGSFFINYLIVYYTLATASSFR
tara:strand:+ start:10 stop:564 length:555 start_codon:yes stop_codon:yes gene_type:complete